MQVFIVVAKAVRVAWPKKHYYERGCDNLYKLRPKSILGIAFAHGLPGGELLLMVVVFCFLAGNTGKVCSVLGTPPAASYTAEAS